MSISGLTAQQKEYIVRFLKQKFAVHTVLLFGSAAKGILRSDSDVDIAFLSSDSSSSAYERFMAAAELADVLKRDVDLIDFAGASPVFQTQIIGQSEILYEAEPYLRQTAFIRAMKEYVYLNDERREILERAMEDKHE